MRATFVIYASIESKDDAGHVESKSELKTKQNKK